MWEGSSHESDGVTASFGYANIDAPNTQPNRHAFETWEDAEGGNWQNTAHCNPLNTTQPEPGSYPINSAGVQAYVNGHGRTCWSWGIKATGDTLLSGSGSNRVYRDILHALRNPLPTDHGQCEALADAGDIHRGGQGTSPRTAEAPGAWDR